MTAREAVMRSMCAAAVVVLATGAIASAQTPMGSEFQISEGPTHSWYSAVGSDAVGNFVVVWQDGQYIPGRRFDRFGNLRGSTFSVNQTPGGAVNFRPSMTMAPDGEFVVVWQHSVHGFPDFEIFARRFAPGGQPIGGEFQVNTYTTGSQGPPKAKLHPTAKDLVVIWSDPARDGSNDGVYAQRFNAANARVGAEFLVHPLNTQGQQLPGGVDYAASGGFVIAWSDAGNGTGFASALAQRYDASGSRVGAPFVIGSAPGASKRAPRPVYAPDGTILIAFEEGDGDGAGVAVRRFSGAGVPVGSQTQVNTYTTGHQIHAWLAMDAAGNYVVQWRDNSASSDGSDSGIKARFYSAADAPTSDEMLVNTYTTNAQATTSSGPSVSSDAAGNVVLVWQSEFAAVGNRRIRAQRYVPNLRPVALKVDTPGNGLIEPGETVDVRPAWRNGGTSAHAFTGTLSGFTGPAGPVYSMTDTAGDYGSVPPNTIVECIDCYEVAVSDPPVRPSVHWDATAFETIGPIAAAPRSWTFHIGKSFDDVPLSHPYYTAVETLLHHGVTAGCRSSDASEFCPNGFLNREQVASLVLAAKEGAGYAPPACVSPPMFDDVPDNSPFCSWIEELARRGAITGCRPRRYCPNRGISRQEVAVVLVKIDDPTANPPTCVPPNIYPDVPETNPYCRWIEDLANRSVVADCGGGNYCPTARMTRGVTAVFLTALFDLALYGP